MPNALPPLSQRIELLAESATLAAAQRVRELQSQGLDVLSLTVGEPDFATPDHIAEAAIAAIRAGHTQYPPVPGIMPLRQAISDKLARENGLRYRPEQIVVSTGAKQCLYNALVAVLDADSEVIIPAPFWVSYVPMTLLAGARPVVVPTTAASGYKLTPELLRQTLTPRTRLLMLCTPSNPTGAVYTTEELAALAEVLATRPDVWVLSDEIYEHLIYEGVHLSPATFSALADRTIIVNGVSKAFAMTGWRIGWMAAPAPVAAAATKVQGQVTSGANHIAQYAALAAINGPLDAVVEMREAFRKRRALVADLAREHMPQARFDVPPGAFYLFMDVSDYLAPDRRTPEGQPLASGDDLARYLLDQALVSTVGGESFGAPGHLRCSYAASEAVLRECFTRMGAALAKL